MLGIFSAFIPVIFVIFIVLLWSHDQKLEKSFADNVEYRLARNVSYRGFYAKIRYSCYYNIFYLKIDDRMGETPWLIPDDKKEETEHKTESEALNWFFYVIDSILDDDIDYPFSMEKITELAEKRHISQNEAELSMYYDLVMRYMTRDSSRRLL